MSNSEKWKTLKIQVTWDYWFIWNSEIPVKNIASPYVIKRGALLIIAICIAREGPEPIGIQRFMHGLC